MPSRILAALRRPKRIATSLPELRYLVFQGMKGETGDSAYEEAVQLGFEGTEEEWLASLKGDTGANGRDGQDGAPGTPGADGEDGVSPTVQTAAITGGHRVTITDKAHPQGQSFDVMNGANGTVPAYLDRTAGVVRLVKGDAVYTSEMMQSDLDDGVPPLITAYGESGEEFFELDTRLVSASPTVGFRSREHLLAVDSTGHFTMTDRPQIDSVNGKTGAVVLDASDVGALPDDTQIPSKTSDLTNDSGFVTAQQAAAAAPVQSVNGKTGPVTVNEVPDYSHAIDGQVLTKAQDGPRWADNNPSSGAALRLLYDGAFAPDDPDLMLMGNVANAETGNAIATALYTGRIGSAVLVDVTDSNTEVVYDLFAVDYDAQTHVSTVTFARSEADCIRTATLSGSTKTAPVYGTIPLAGGTATDAVLYTPQDLTDEQQAQARENIGAGTYTKPSGGIPASDLAAGVIPTVPQMATQTDMSDWTSGKTVDASAMKTVVSAARTVILENSGEIDSLKSDKQNAPLEIPVTESGDTYSTTATAEQIRAAKENSVFVLGDGVRIKALLWFPLDEGVELLIGMQKLNGTILTVGANVSNNSVSIGVEQTTIPTAVSELTNDSGYQTASDVQTAIAGVRQLPTVSASDNGKFLRVVSGAWAAETVSTWQGGSY